MKLRHQFQGLLEDFRWVATTWAILKSPLQTYLGGCYLQCSMMGATEHIVMSLSVIHAFVHTQRHTQTHPPTTYAYKCKCCSKSEPELNNCIRCFHRQHPIRVHEHVGSITVTPLIKHRDISGMTPHAPTTARPYLVLVHFHRCLSEGMCARGQTHRSHCISHEHTPGRVSGVGHLQCSRMRVKAIDNHTVEDVPVPPHATSPQQLLDVHLVGFSGTQ